MKMVFQAFMWLSLLVVLSVLLDKVGALGGSGVKVPGLPPGVQYGPGGQNGLSGNPLPPGTSVA